MHSIALLLALTTPLTPASLRTAAHDYYEWQKSEFPVFASDQGFHAYDDRLADYSAEAIARRAARVRELLEVLNSTDVSGWSKDDKIDWILFRAQLNAPKLSARR